MAQPDAEAVTALLDAMSAGDRLAAERLLPLIYADLHDRAQRLMRRERDDHTLQPTALVNEAYMRLVDQRVVQWKSRSHFLGVACEAMHRVLLDHARTRSRKKRGAGTSLTSMPEVMAEGLDWTASQLETIAEAIESLAGLNEREATVVKLRFFAGLSEIQVAEHLGVSKRTVQRLWAHARAWLRRELDEERDHGF